jgi:hypothetical protein
MVISSVNGSSVRDAISPRMRDVALHRATPTRLLRIVLTNRDTRRQSSKFPIGSSRLDSGYTCMTMHVYTDPCFVQLVCVHCDFKIHLFTQEVESKRVECVNVHHRRRHSLSHVFACIPIELEYQNFCFGGCEVHPHSHITTWVHLGECVLRWIRA